MPRNQVFAETLLRCDHRLRKRGASYPAGCPQGGVPDGYADFTDEELRHNPFSNKIILMDEVELTLSQLTLSQSYVSQPYNIPRAHPLTSSRAKPMHRFTIS